MLKKRIQAMSLIFALVFTLSSCNLLSFVSQNKQDEVSAVTFAIIDESAETPGTDLIEEALASFIHDTAVELQTSFAQADYKTNITLEEISAFLSEKTLQLGASALDSQWDELPANVLWYYSGAYHNNSAAIHVLVEQDGELLHIYISLY